MIDKFIVRQMSTKQRAWFRARITRVQMRWLAVVQKSEFLCRLHTLILSRDLSLEARAVISGRLKSLENRKSTEAVNYFLRRGVHRIEKGMIMPERRSLFALGYIQELTQAFSQAVAANGDPEELAWAHGVLSAYFSLVDNDPVVQAARDVFEAAGYEPEKVDSPTTPYFRESYSEPPVNPDAFLKLARLRRSVRFYEPQPVPRELLDRAVEMAALSPSACNRQPFEFKIFDDPESTKRISALAGGTAGFSHQIPCLIVIVGRLRAYVHARDRHAIYVDGGLAAMSLMFALETLELASCPINWPDVRNQELAMAKALGLSADERVVMLVSVGYAQSDTKIAASKKVALGLLRTYEDVESASS